MSKTSFRTWLSLLPELPTNIRNWEAFLVHAVKMKIYDLWKSAAHKNEKLLLDDARPLEEERHGGDDFGLDPAVVVEETHERAATVAQVRAALAELDRREPQAAYAYRQVKEFGRTSQAVADELDVSSSSTPGTLIQPNPPRYLTSSSSIYPRGSVVGLCPTSPLTGRLVLFTSGTFGTL